MSDQKHILVVPSALNHTTLYLVLYEILAPRGWQFTFAADETILASLKKRIGDQESVEYFVRNEGERQYSLLRRFGKKLNSVDMAVFDEIYGSLMSLVCFFLFHRIRAKKYFILHNANTWLNPRLILKGRYLLQCLARRFLLKQMNGLITISSNIKEYIHTSHGYQGKIFPLPFTMPSKSFAQSSSEKEYLTFCVPGVINAEQRSYELILDAFENLWIKHDEKVALKFVGKFEKNELTQKLFERCQSLQEKYGENKLKFWTSSLNQDLFEQEFSGSDVVILGHHAYCSISRNIEIYGLSKESGITYQILKYGLPVIAPRRLLLMDTIPQGILRYSDSESLEKLVSQIINRSLDVNELRQEMIQATEDFRIWCDIQIRNFQQDIE